MIFAQHACPLQVEVNVYHRIPRDVECNKSRYGGGNLNVRHLFPNGGDVQEILGEIKALVREVVHRNWIIHEVEAHLRPNHTHKYQ